MDGKRKIQMLNSQDVEQSKYFKRMRYIHEYNATLDRYETIYVNNSEIVNFQCNNETNVVLESFENDLNRDITLDHDYCSNSVNHNSKTNEVSESLENDSSCDILDHDYCNNSFNHNNVYPLNGNMLNN